jgi:hypothetical protein
MSFVSSERLQKIYYFLTSFFNFVEISQQHARSLMPNFRMNFYEKDMKAFHLSRTPHDYLLTFQLPFSPLVPDPSYRGAQAAKLDLAR